MIGEINRNFYCSANCYNQNYCGYGDGIDTDCAKNQCHAGCANYHRKWPTPEQFKAEYGHEWLDDAAVYRLQDRQWYIDVKRNTNKYQTVVCACTPWGKPPADWRPE